MLSGPAAPAPRSRMTISGPLNRLFPLSLLAVVSFAVAIGWTLDLHNADSLIPTFVSLDHWLPFFWGQDRFGMLLALVTAPVRDSFWNLVAQNALGVFLMLAGAYAAAGRCGVRHPELVALALLSVLLAWPAETTALQLLTTNQSYGPALGWYALGFALATPERAWTARFGGVLLMVLGAWTNAGSGLLLLAVFAVAAAMPRLRPVALSLVAGTVLSLAAHLALQGLAPGIRLDRSHVTLADFATVTATAAGFWTDAYRLVLGPAIWLALPLSGLAFWLEGRNLRGRDAIFVVLVASVSYAFTMIVLFGGTGRHITPVVPLLLGMLLVVFGRHAAMPGGGASIPAAALALVILWQSGADWPEIGRRRLLTRLADGHAVELYQEDVTVVTGDYWRAWPYAFALNMLHERVSGARPVLPVAMRGENLYDDRASQFQRGTRVAVVPPADYRYWRLRGPTVALSVVRVAPDYEVAIVTADEGHPHQ
jgi:hypothetical protein